MFLLSLSRHALPWLLPLSLFLTTYLYLYPVFNLCAFPASSQATSFTSPGFLNTLRCHTKSSAYEPSLNAPFRLLALGDPQLEGDTSLPEGAGHFPNWQNFVINALSRKGTYHSPLQRVRSCLHDLVDLFFDDVPKTLAAYHKRLDLLGNDFYLAHIYRTLHWWTKPTHVTVLGDLVGSQWIDDKEFDERAWRFWNRVVRNGRKVEDEVHYNGEQGNVPDLASDAQAWSTRVINIAGNHDIGYAGDLTPARFERFERTFGRANYELRFQLYPQYFLDSLPDDHVLKQNATAEGNPQLRIVVLNDMNLDTPAVSTELQGETYDFINRVIADSHPVTRKGVFTLLLTHIPLHKEAGICVDAPFFDFHNRDEFAYGVREQNHLSLPASKGLLEGIFGKSGNEEADGQGKGRRGVILTGHDHDGCDVWHFINQSAPAEEREWQAARWKNARKQGLVGKALEGLPGLREITVRSMMGEFGGNAGLLSLWFDSEEWEWKFEFATCSLGVQHWWWAIHIQDLITLGLLLSYCTLAPLKALGLIDRPKRKVLVRRTSDTKQKQITATPANGSSTKPRRQTISKMGLDGINRPDSEHSSPATSRSDSVLQSIEPSLSPSPSPSQSATPTASITVSASPSMTPTPEPPSTIGARRSYATRSSISNSAASSRESTASASVTPTPETAAARAAMSSVTSASQRSSRQATASVTPVPVPVPQSVQRVTRASTRSVSATPDAEMEVGGGVEVEMEGGKDEYTAKEIEEVRRSRRRSPMKRGSGTGSGSGSGSS